MALSNTDLVTELYVGYFNRAPDPAGLQFWLNSLAAGATFTQIADSFSKSSEATFLYPYLSLPGVVTPDSFVTSIYNNLLNRAPDAAGQAFWVNLLNTKQLTPGGVISAILGSVNQQVGTPDALTVANKIAAGEYYVSTVATAGVPYTQDSAKAALFGVTSDANTVIASKATTDAYIVAPTQAIPLTTGPDNIAGTLGNDVINGAVYTDSPSTSTFQIIDTINGSGGTDKLNITVSKSDGGATGNVVLPAASVSNVETINLRALSATAANTLTIDASLTTGVTAINSDRSISAVVVNNLASGASAGMVGNGVVANGALTANYVAAATAATVNISGGTTAGAVLLSGTGLKSTTVNSTGAANTIGALTLAASDTALTINATTNLTTGAVTNSTAAALTTLTVTGAGAVNLSATALENTVATINASANTGGFTVSLPALATVKATGGSGNDVFTVSGTDLTTGSVDAGAGKDTLVLGTTDDASTAALAAKFTNFETVRFNGTLDASLISGITALEISGATNTITKLSATQAAAVTALADIGATSFALATDTGTSDALSLTLGDGKGAAFDAGALTINGFETLNVKANALSTDADQTSVIASFTADKLTAINLTGSAVTLTNAATSKAVTIDASALTGNGAATPVGLTESGNLTVGSTVIGSGVKDVFNLGTVGSTYNGGAGNDTFAATSVAQLHSGIVYNTIDGGAGSDTVSITSASSITLVDDDFKGITNVEKLVFDGVTSTGVGNISITTGGWYDGNFKVAGSNVTISAEDGDAVSFTGGSFSGAQTLSITTASDGVTTADNVSVLTGSGNDAVTVTAASWVGATGGSAGAINVSTGAGADTISVSTGTLLAVTGTAPVTITGGAGADTISAVHTNAASGLGFDFAVAAGDSGKAAFDSITGFKMSDIGGTGGKISDGLDFGTAAIATTVAATAVSGYTAPELTYAINGTTGEVTFAGTSAAALTAAQVIDILDTVVANGLTAFWTSSTDTYIYNADAAGDSVVKLVGINADALLTTNNATTDNGVFIH